MNKLQYILPALLLVASCDTEEPEEPEVTEQVRVEFVEVPHAPHRAEDRSHAHARPKHIAPKGREMFDEVVALVGEHYVDGALSEDELWTAAAEGVLGRLIQLKGEPVSTLLSPTELARLKSGAKGRVVGIGVVLEPFADGVLITSVIAGGPADAAGLQPGDRILGVDGERLKGLAPMEVAGRITGDEGTEVELFVQRDTEEWSETITRKPFVVPSVESRMFDSGVGVVRINNFAEATTDEVSAALESLEEQGMKSVVIDLRKCPGGLLEPALKTADLFLAPGRRIVSVRSHGETEEHTDAESSDPWETLPVAVLVGPHTASGAEILAAALSENDRAPVIGEQTYGKGTVESVHSLSNGWAVKLSVSRFYSPEGENRQDVGLRPDIVVPHGEEDTWEPLRRVDIAADSQLAAAHDLLRAR